MEWYEFKNWLEMVTGLDRDSLHIYGAIGSQLLVALISRRPLASVWPWLGALVVTLANEYGDLSQFESWSDVYPSFWEAVYQDIWNSMLLPTVLMLIARQFPGWLVFQNSSAENDFIASHD